MAGEKYIEVGGRLHSIATGNVLAGANEIIDDEKEGKKQSIINAETDAALEDRYTKDQTYSKSELNNMITTPNQEYVSVTATAQTTAVTDLLPATGEADTVYRVGNWDGSQYDPSVYSEYAWNGSQYVHLSTKTQIGEVFDISAYHATGGTLATYADLSAALDSNNGGGVPQSLQKGGMSVKYVLSSDNKYVQYRCIADEFTTDITQWAIAEEGVYVENPEFVYVKTDKEGKILWAIRTDGDIYYGAGCPQQVKDYIEKRISGLSFDKYEDMVAFLQDFLGTDTTLKVLLDSKANAADVETALETKADKTDVDEIQKKLNHLNLAIDPDRGVLRVGEKMFKLIDYTGPADFDKDIDYTIFIEATTTVENPEWQKAITDSEDRLLYGKKQNSGEEYWPQEELEGHTMTVDGVTASVNKIIKNLK